MVRRNLFIRRAGFREVGLNYDHSQFRFRRLYVDAYFNGVKLEAQLDSGADTNLISLDIINAICPEWRQLKSAGRLSLTSASSDPITVKATRWINLKLSEKDTHSRLHKFAIVDTKGFLLLSSELIYSLQLSLHWKKDHPHPFISWKNKSNSSYFTAPTWPASRYAKATNKTKIEFKPSEQKCVSMTLNSSSRHSECEVTNILDHSLNVGSVSSLVILPTHSVVSNQASINAVILNVSDKSVSVPPNSLQADVRFNLPSGEELISVDDLISDSSTISSLLEEKSFQQYPIANLPQDTLSVYSRVLAAQAETLCNKEKGGKNPSPDSLDCRKKKTENTQNFQDNDLASAGYTPSQEEREEKLRKLYNEDKDVADFARDYGQDLGFEKPLPEFQPLEQFDINSVEPAYRAYVRYLLNKYDFAMSRHPFDIGDTSKTLGYLTIPLVRELPRCNNKVYSLQGHKREILKSILLMMLKHKMIERSSTDKLACPCFIIGKKDPNSSPRFLIDSTQINSYLATTHQILPKIGTLLQELGNIKPKLISSMDISSAYHSIKLSPRTSNNIHISTEFGTFKALCTLQGLAPVPGIYSQYMQIALHSDHKNNMRPDIIPNVHFFLDDVLAASGSSNLDLTLQKAILSDISKFEHEKDKIDPSFQPLNSQQKQDALSHLLLLDSVLERLAYHGFKFAPKKLSLFQKSAKVLGHIVDSKGLTVDKERIDKMVNAPLPENRTQMQRFLGFLSSVKYFSPPELSQQHAVLAPLTSAKVEFKLNQTHIDAFNKAKALLTSQPFYLDFPDYEACKILFTDASDILLSGVLMDIQFPALYTENVPINTSSDNSLQMDVHQNDDLLFYSNKLHSFNLMCLRFSSKPLSSFFEATCCLIELANMANVPTNHKFLRTAVLSHIDNSALKQEFSSILSGEGTSLQQFLENFAAAHTGIDKNQFLISATARYLDRELIIVTHNSGKLQFKVHSSSMKAKKKPVFWLYLDNNTQQFSPLIQYGSNNLSKFTSYSTVHNDLPYMPKDEIVQAMKSFISNPKKAGVPLKCNVVGYFSQVIPAIDRDKAIWLKESQALINSLYKFKSLLELAPIVVSFCDSSVVYLLCQRAITESCLKIRRTAAMLKLEYPNLIVTGLPGKDNISDYLSRIMTLPSVVTNSINSKQIQINQCSELDFKPFSLTEAELFIDNMPIKHSVMARTENTVKEDTEQPSILLAVDDSLDARAESDKHELSRADKILLDTITPAKTLGNRLANNEIITAQQKWIEETRNDPDQINCDKNFCFDVTSGMYKFKGNIFLPPTLEGVALSYYHLIAGHIGQRKLHDMIRTRYYFPDLVDKCRVFCEACHACALVNPNRKSKFMAGSVPIPSHSWETISLDFLEVSKNSTGVKAVLVLTDHFSKTILTFLMKSTAAGPVLEKLREFLMYTGCATRYILTDNGSPFSGGDFNKFLFLMGIYKIQSTPYLSRARGQVESCNRIVNILLRKLLLLSPRYNFQDLLFLAPVMYNSSVNHQTKLSPYTILYGRVPALFGPLSGKTREAPKMFSETVRAELERLRDAIAERVATTRQLLQEHQERYLKKVNSRRRPFPDIKIGDICFIKNNSVMETGARSKLRPRLYKSPFVVIASKVSSVIVMRLADSFVTSRHPDDILVYSEKTKKQLMLQDLGPEVWAILGEPLDKDKLESLAKSDQLPLIYTDKILENPTRPVTRSLRKQAKLLENAFIENEEDDELNAYDSVTASLNDPNNTAPKRVRFDLPGTE